MRLTAVSLLISVVLSASAAAQENAERPRADGWLRVSLSDRTLVQDGSSAAGGMISGNIAFGGMMNQMRLIGLVTDGLAGLQRVQEVAILVGARSIEHNRSLSIAGGLGLVSDVSRRRTVDSGSPPGYRTEDIKSDVYPGVALELHGTGFVKKWFGVGAGVVANLNARHSFASIIMSMDIGDLYDPKR